MSTGEKHSTLQEASGRQEVTEPSSSDFLPWFDHSEIQNFHDAPRRKRRKRFLKADKDCSHASLHGKVYPNYDDHSDFDDVFSTDPGIREPIKEVVKCKDSWILLNTPFSQHTSRGIDSETGCLGLTQVSDLTVGQLISDMQSFTFKGSMKRPASQRRKRRSALVEDDSEKEELLPYSGTSKRHRSLMAAGRGGEGADSCVKMVSTIFNKLELNP